MFCKRVIQIHTLDINLEKSSNNLLNRNTPKKGQSATHSDAHLFQNNILLGSMMDALPKINKPLIIHTTKTKR